MAHWTLRLGGAQIVMCKLSEHFRALGHEVDFLTTVTPGPSVPSMRECCSQYWHFAKQERETPGIYLPKLANEIVRRGYDVLMTHHSVEAVSVAAYLPPSIRTISVIHDDPVRGFGHVALSSPEAFDRFVAVSESVFRMSAQILGSDPRLKCISNGIEEVPMPLRAPSPRLRSLFVGRLDDRQKGCLLLPEIIRQTLDLGVDVELEVIGDGEDRRRLEGAILEHGVSDAIRLEGALGRQEALRAMERAEVLLHCSRHEGLSLVVVEAMMRGSVPLAYRLPSTEEIISHGVDGILVDKRRAAQFAARLKELVENPAVLHEMAFAGHQTACRRFSEDRMFAQYDLLLSQLGDGCDQPIPLRKHASNIHA